MAEDRQRLLIAGLKPDRDRLSGNGGQQPMAEWHKFTKRTMPEVNGKTFLLCRGYKDPDDQIMCTAKRVQILDEKPYIRYIGHHGQGEFGWRVLPEEEYKDTLWREIDYP